MPAWRVNPRSAQGDTFFIGKESRLLGCLKGDQDLALGSAQVGIVAYKDWGGGGSRSPQDSPCCRAMCFVEGTGQAAGTWFLPKGPPR